MRDVTLTNFANGPIKFQFAVNPAERGKFKESFFKARLRLNASDNAGAAWTTPTKSFPGTVNFYDAAGFGAAAFTANVPTAGDDVTFSENVLSNLFQGINFKMNGITLDEINNYQPQVDAAIRRLTESYAAQQSTKYQDLFGMTLRERIDMVSSNSTNFSGFGFDGAGAVNATPNAQGLATAATNKVNLYPSTCPFSSNVIEVCWRPRSLGIFNIDQFLPTGQYEIELTPFIDYAINAIESVLNLPPGSVTGNTTAPPTARRQYMVSVEDLRYYLPVCGSPDEITDMTYYLSLEEYQVQPKPLLSGQNTYNYVVPWTTQTLAFMLQTSAIGRQTLVPPSKFLNIRPANLGAPALNNQTMIDPLSNDLKFYQLTYSKTYPKNNIQSQFAPFVTIANPAQSGINRLYFRYLDTFSNSQSEWAEKQEPFSDATNSITMTYANDGGANTRPQFVPIYGFSTCDYISRGAIYCVSVAKSQNDKTVDAQLVVEYNTDVYNGQISGPVLSTPSAPNLLLIACFKKVAKISMLNGTIASVDVALG